MKTDGHLLFSGASDVRILGALQGDNGSEIGPATTATALKANDIIIYVGSTDQQSAFSTAVNINPKTVLSANVYAENGTILLNQQITATGAFIGKSVVVGSNSTVTFAPSAAFNGVLPLFTWVAQIVGAGSR